MERKSNRKEGLGNELAIIQERFEDFCVSLFQKQMEKIPTSMKKE